MNKKVHIAVIIAAFVVTAFAVAGYFLLTTTGCTPAPKKHISDGLTGGTLVFSDDFERQDIGTNWLNKSGKWQMKDGWLHVQGDENAGVWLNSPLPDRTRVEFDAKSLSSDGDLKFEIFARAKEHQTGYIAILGGWKNKISIIARLNEHGEDRLESDANVTIGKVHHFTAVRTDNVLKWYVDGNLILQFPDKDPIDGVYFAFNNWASDAWYDNLKIFELPPQ